MSYITVSPKGQITLPSRMRKKMGLAPGTRLEIENQDDVIILRPAGSIFELKGFLGRGQSPAAERRGMMKGLGQRHKSRKE